MLSRSRIIVCLSIVLRGMPIGLLRPSRLCERCARCSSALRQESLRPDVQQPQLPLPRLFRRRRLERLDGQLDGRVTVPQVRTPDADGRVAGCDVTRAAACQ